MASQCVPFSFSWVHRQAHRGIRRFSNELVRQLHFGKLGREQQVLGEDVEAVVGRGGHQLLHAAPLPIGLDAYLGLRDQLLL